MNFLKKNFNEIIVLLIWFAVAIGGTSHVHSLYRNTLIEKARVNSSEEVNSFKNYLESSLNHDMDILNSLGKFAEIHPDKEFLDAEFQNQAIALLSSHENIRNIILSPSGINAYVYPLQGNEQALNHDIINDEREQVRVDVQKTISTREIVLSGPYELRQGGLGLVARKAVYIDKEFWGLASMVIDLPPVFSSLPENEILIQDDSGNTIFGKEEVLQEDVAESIIQLPNEVWKLSYYSKFHSQEIDQQMRLFQIFRIIILFLISMIIIKIMYDSKILKRKLDTAKGDLKIKEKTIENNNKNLVETNDKLLKSEREIKIKNEELEKAMEDFYSVRITLQKDMDSGNVKAENEKIKKRIDEIKIKK